MNRAVQTLKEKLRAMTRRQWITLLLPVAVLLGITAVLYAVFGRRLLVVIEDPQAFKAWIDSFGVWGEAAFVGIRTAQTVFKFIPAEPLEVGSGYAFGVWGGLFLCMLGTELGSAVILLLSKNTVCALFPALPTLKSFGNFPFCRMLVAYARCCF